MPVAVANYRTRLEAELAAAFLEDAAIPYVIQSLEGILHGPLGPGATLLVRPEHAALARELLRDPPDTYQGRAVCVTRLADAEAASAAHRKLDREGVPYLMSPAGSFPAALFVRSEHVVLARYTLGLGSAESS